MKCPGCGTPIWYQLVSSNMTREERLYDMQQVSGKNVEHRCDPARCRTPLRVAAEALITAIDAKYYGVVCDASGVRHPFEDAVAALRAALGVKT